jgi:hypothetical protein
VAANVVCGSEPAAGSTGQGNCAGAVAWCASFNYDRVAFWWQIRASLASDP